MGDELHKRVVGRTKRSSRHAGDPPFARGLKNPKRLIGSFIFFGPTGVGKTEVARSVASSSSTIGSMIRIDMSEYMEKYVVSRLVGAPRDTSATKRAGN